MKKPRRSAVKAKPFEWVGYACSLAKPRFYLQNPRILCRVLSKKKILRFAVLLVVLFVDFGAELDLGSAVALKSTKSLL